MDSDTAGLVLSPDAYGGPVQAGPGSPMLVGPAYLSTMEPVQEEMLLSSLTCGDLVHLLRNGQDGALRMTFNGMSPHYNDGQTLMSTPVDMSVAAVLLDVDPQELAPVVAAAGRALGAARDRIENWQSDGLPQALTYAQTKAIACGEQVDVAPSAAARARASFQDGGPAVTDALARLHAPLSQGHPPGPCSLRTRWADDQMSTPPQVPVLLDAPMGVRQDAHEAGLEPAGVDARLGVLRVLRVALADPAVRARYEAKVYRTPGCWYWSGALHSRGGHGRK